MPSDAKKKKEQQKKAVRKQKDIKKTKNQEEEEEDQEQEQDDQQSNEDETTTTTTTTPTTATDEQSNGVNETVSSKPVKNVKKREDDEDEIEARLKAISLLEKTNSDNRSCTGVLASHPNGRDIHIHQFSLTFYGQELFVDADLELNYGRRYGLIGLNGSGKSSMLAAIANKEIPIPEHVDIFHLAREIPATNKTALEAVLEADEEIMRLEAEAEKISCNDDTESQERLNDIYERLDALNSDTREVRAACILNGLGFTADMQKKKCKGIYICFRMEGGIWVRV
jgi:ATP-binding cassette, subfamily F, member 2